jgi:hypothetical protein
MRPEFIFMQWLRAMLRDEQWRAIIRAQMQQYDLPVIELRARADVSDPNRHRGAGK